MSKRNRLFKQFRRNWKKLCKQTSLRLFPPKNIQSTILSEILELLPGHVYWYDKEGIFFGCNHQQAKTLGFPSIQDLIGKNFYHLQPPDKVESVKKTNEAVYRTGTIQTAEESGFYEDQELIFLSKKVPWRNKYGEIIGIIGISFDVTQEHKLKNELSEAKVFAENTLSTLLDNLSGHIYIKDLSGAYLYCNQGQADSLELKAEDIIGKTDYGLSSKKLADKFRQADLHVIQSKKTMTIEEKIKSKGQDRILDFG